MRASCSHADGRVVVGGGGGDALCSGILSTKRSQLHLISNKLSSRRRCRHSSRRSSRHSILASSIAITLNLTEDCDCLGDGPENDPGDLEAKRSGKRAGEGVYLETEVNEGGGEEESEEAGGNSNICELH